MKKVLDFIKQSKSMILVIIGVLTALVTVLNTTEEVVESIPVKIDSVQVDSIVVDSISHE